MNHSPTTGHLSQDDLLKALIDRSDLQPEGSAHLKACPFCRQRLDRISQRFYRIGRIAAQLAPTPANAIRTGARRTTSHRGNRTLWAAGLAVVMILLFTTFWPQTPGDEPLAPQPGAMIPDRDLLRQVDALVENALPAAIRQLAAVAAPHDDEDLIKWIMLPIHGEL